MADTVKLKGVFGFIIYAYIYLPFSIGWFVSAEPREYYVKRGQGIGNADSKTDSVDIFGLRDNTIKCNGHVAEQWCNGTGGLPLYDETCSCKCEKMWEKKTYVENLGACHDVRNLYGGCALYTSNEFPNGPLRVMNLQKSSGSVNMAHGISGCTIHEESSYYYSAQGGWRKIVTGTSGLQFLFTNAGEKDTFKWSGGGPDNVYNGTIIKLNVTCTNPEHIVRNKSCLLFKAAGTYYYNFTNLLSPTSSALIQPSWTTGLIFQSSASSYEYFTKSFHATSLWPSVSPSTPVSVTSQPPTHSMATLATVIENFTISPSPVKSPSTALLLSTITSALPSTSHTPKPKGKPEAQSRTMPGTIAGGVVAGVLLIIVVVLIIFCRRRKLSAPSPTKPCKNTEEIGRNNSTYGSDTGLVLKPYQPRSVGDTGHSQGESAGDYDYAAVDDMRPSNRSSVPVYLGLGSSAGDQTYETLEENTGENATQECDGPLYNELEGPVSDPGTLPNRGHPEPLYNVLDETSNETGKEYRSLTNDRQDHEYKSLEHIPDNEAVYNVLEDPTMDYDNISDEEAPNRTGAQNNPSYGDDYAKLEGPHTRAPISKGPTGSQTYDVLERPCSPAPLINKPTLPSGNSDHGVSEQGNGDYAKLQGSHRTVKQSPKHLADSPDYDVLERPEDAYQSLDGTAKQQPVHPPLDSYT